MATLALYGFASIISNRVSFAAQVAEMLEAQKIDEASFAEALLQAVPKRLRKFVLDQEVIETLMKYGTYSDRYGYNIRGLQTYESVVAALEELRVAWKDNVIITIDNPVENGRVSIRYFAAPHIY